MKRALGIGFVAGAVLGSVITHWWTSGRPATRTTSNGTDASLTKSTNTPNPGTSSASKLPGEAATTSSPRSTDAGESDESPTSAARTPTQPRVGTKSIRGCVLDNDGHPVAGVVVQAVRDTASREASNPRRGRRTFVSSNRSNAGTSEGDSADRVETETGSDGRYALQRLVDGHWRISASRDGYDIHRYGRDGDLDEDLIRPDADVDFAADPLTMIRIDVLLPDGSPAPRAMIEARSDGDELAEDVLQWTPASDRLGLEEGEREIRATLGDPENTPAWPVFLASPFQHVEPGPGNSTRAIQLRLATVTGIRGEVRAAPGTTASIVEVDLFPIPPGTEPSPHYRAAQGARRHYVESGDSYCFSDLTPGRYVVGIARRWGGGVIASALVEVDRDMVVRDLEVPAADPRECVIVTSKDTAGRPVDDISFSYAFSSETGSGGGGVHGGSDVERRADGSYLVPLSAMAVFDEERDADVVDESGRLRWPKDLTLTLEIESRRYGKKSSRILSTTRSVDFVFPAPARVLVTVEGSGDSALLGRVRVSLEKRIDQKPEEDDFLSAYAGELVQDGSCRFGPIEPDEYELRVLVAPRGRNEGQTSVVDRRTVAIVSGENHITLGVPPLYSLTVDSGSQSKRSIGIARVSDIGERGHEIDSTVDAAGQALFENLVAGDYVLTRNDGSGSDEMHVRVPAPGIVRYHPQPLNALAIWIQDPKGRLARAGFQEDDVLFAIDGERYDDAGELRAAIAARLSNPKIVFTLARGKTTLDLTVDSSALSNAFDLGGWFFPTSH